MWVSTSRVCQHGPEPLSRSKPSETAHRGLRIRNGQTGPGRLQKGQEGNCSLLRNSFLGHKELIGLMFLMIGLGCLQAMDLIEYGSLQHFRRARGRICQIYSRHLKTILVVFQANFVSRKPRVEDERV